MTASIFPVKPLLVALLLLAAFDLRAAELPADGLYLAAPGAPLPRFSMRDGLLPDSQEELLMSLGARRDLQILDKRLRSTSNDDTMFQLLLTVPYDATLLPNAYFLVIAGTVYRLSGTGSFDRTTSRLVFPISKDENPTEVARRLDIPIEYARHPGHRLRVSFTPTRASFARGEEVTVTLRIVNLGTEPIAFMREARANRNNQFIFSAHLYGQTVPDVGSSPNADVLAYPFVLQPAATLEDTVSLNNWFEFQDAGRYQVHGSYYLSFVEPGDGFMDTIWTDYVGADFIVTID